MSHSIEGRPLLGVNIDHVATLRQARGTTYPDPLYAALIAEQAGADGITLHLREDRRHINERDVNVMKAALQTRMNLEMAATKEMVDIALNVSPEHCCLVPEKREELTTEGGLDIANAKPEVFSYIDQLVQNGIEVSLFIDPEQTQIDVAKRSGAQVIELHTGQYAEETEAAKRTAELKRIAQAAEYAKSIGLIVNAGHGLHYKNVQPIAAIPEIHELNIGHSIVAQAVFVGFAQAVKEMKALIEAAR